MPRGVNSQNASLNSVARTTPHSGVLWWRLTPRADQRVPSDLRELVVGPREVRDLLREPRLQGREPRRPGLGASAPGETVRRSHRV